MRSGCMATHAISHGSTDTAQPLNGRAAVVAVGVQTLFLFALTTLPTPLYRDYGHEDGFSVLTLTLIYATYVVGTVGTLAIFGRLSDQIGRRPVALLALGVAALSAVLFAISHALPMLFVERLLTGIASGLSSGACVAWLQELSESKENATPVTVAFNNFGLGFGPLLSGVLAQFAPWPLQLSFVVYLVLVIVTAAFIFRTTETMEKTKPLSLKPRIGVPRDLVGRFLAPCIISFVLFSLVGFYSAIVTGLIADTLRIDSHAAAGAIVFELFAVATAAAFLGKLLGNRPSMLWGAGLMLPTLALLVLAQLEASLWMLLAGTAIGGLSLGIGYLGTLQVSNEMAPQDKRAELISVLFICGNLGLAVPVLGVGVTAALTSPATANLVFAGVIALLSIGGLAFGFSPLSKQK